MRELLYFSEFIYNNGMGKIPSAFVSKGYSFRAFFVSKFHSSCQWMTGIPSSKVIGSQT